MSLELKLAHFRKGSNCFRRWPITFYVFHKNLPKKCQKKYPSVQRKGMLLCHCCIWLYVLNGGNSYVPFSDGFNPSKKIRWVHRWIDHPCCFLLLTFCFVTCTLLWCSGLLISHFLFVSSVYEYFLHLQGIIIEQQVHSSLNKYNVIWPQITTKIISVVLLITFGWEKWGLYPISYTRPYLLSSATTYVEQNILAFSL